MKVEPVADLTVSDINGRQDAHFDYYGTLKSGQYLLYTHSPTSGKLVKAAEEVLKIADRWRKDIPYGLIVHLENLRAALKSAKKDAQEGK